MEEEAGKAKEEEEAGGEVTDPCASVVQCRHIQRVLVR